MRSRMVTMLGVGLLMTGPALAQSSPSQTQPKSESASGQQPESPQATQMAMKHDLENSGFTDVQIMPESFLIRAKDKEGRPVMMVVNPDSVVAMTRVASNAGGDSDNSNGNSGSSTPLPTGSGTPGSTGSNNSGNNNSGSNSK